jgi:hypothetical protein
MYQLLIRSVQRAIINIIQFFLVVEKKYAIHA